MAHETSDVANETPSLFVHVQGRMGGEKAPDTPKISVVIPTFNAAETLPATLESLREQAFAPHDVIIVDGASKDATLRIANAARDIVTVIVSEPDKGIYDAMNKGCAQARGDLIVVLGADDCLTPVAFEQVAIAWRAGKTDIYAGRAIMVGDDGAVTLRDDEEFSEAALVSGIPFNHNAMYVTQEAYAKIGPYDLNFRLGADAHWVHRAIKSGLSFTRINAPLVRFGLGGASSAAGERIFEESVRVIRENFPYLLPSEAETMLRAARGWLAESDAEQIINRHAQHPDFSAAAKAALSSRRERGSARTPLPRIAGAPTLVARKTPPARGQRSAEPLFSFVVPAYNVEAYVERCLDSIVSQAFDDFEIIVIDDGSTDGTSTILRRYAALDSRIRIFKQENSGQGAARSFGIKAARGRYVWFVDSDDWLLEGASARVARLVRSLEPDVVVLNFEYTFDDKPALPSSRVPAHLAGQMVDPLESAATFSTISCWNVPPWRLLSRRALLLQQDINFATGVFYEDHPYAIKLMLTAQKVFVDAALSYAYYQRATSTTHVNDNKAYDFITIRRQSLDLLRAFGVNEWFAPIVLSYAVPYGFYAAHVGPEQRVEFLRRLDADFTEEEEAFVRRHGGADEARFITAVRTHNPSLIDQPPAQTAPAPPEAPRPSLVQRVRAFAKRARDASLRRGRAFAWRALGLWSLQQELRAEMERNARVTAPSSLPATANPHLEVGSGVRLEGAHVDVRVRQENRPYVRIGDDSHVGGHFVFERGVGEITIGSRSSIGGGSLLICSQPGGIKIGDRVMISWKCTLIDSDSHSLDPDVRASDAYNWKVGADSGQLGAFKDWSGVRSEPIVIEDDAWIGFESVILKGVRIGKGAVVASRSVVTKDVPPYNVVAGSPARFVGLAQRQNWSWDEIIEAAQGDPAQQQMLLDAFMHRDVRAMLKRYRESEEFRDTYAIAREHSAAKTLLDVGGSNGVISIAHALEGVHATMIEPSNSDVVGIRAARRMHALAQSIDPTVKDRVRIIEGVIETAKIDGQFDFVICRQVAHHFDDPVEALKRIHSLVKPDGVVLLLREHVVQDGREMQHFLETHPFHRFYAGEKAYRVEEYEAFARQANFDVVRTYAFRETPINYFPHTAETIWSIPDEQFPGRPYSFILKPKSQA